MNGKYYHKTIFAFFYLTRYHGKCLKFGRNKGKAYSEKFVCPVCDWRVLINRELRRPRLEDLEEWLSQAFDLPLIADEIKLLEKIVNKGREFRKFVRPLVEGRIFDQLSLSEARFYLRKLEGAEILLVEELNMLRREVHRVNPIASSPPPPAEAYIPLVQKKPRSKQAKYEAENVSISPIETSTSPSSSSIVGSTAGTENLISPTKSFVSIQDTLTKDTSEEKLSIDSNQTLYRTLSLKVSPIPILGTHKISSGEANQPPFTSKDQVANVITGKIDKLSSDLALRELKESSSIVQSEIVESGKEHLENAVNDLGTELDNINDTGISGTIASTKNSSSTNENHNRKKDEKDEVAKERSNESWIDEHVVVKDQNIDKHTIDDKISNDFVISKNISDDKSPNGDAI